MKKSILVLTAMVALAFVGCKEKPYIAGPGDNSHNVDSIPILIPDTNGIEVGVDSAIVICNALADNADSPDRYKVSGIVTKNTTTPITVPGSYTNINFLMKDLHTGTGYQITCYYTNNINNVPFRNSNQVPRVGSKVTVLGILNKYVKNGEVTPEIKNGFIVRIDSMVAPGPFPGCPEPDEDEISVTEAVNIAMALPVSTSSSKTQSTSAYNIMGVVTEVMSLSNGKATYIISDGKKYFEVYGGKGINGANLADGAVAANDTLTVNAHILNYNGLPETNGDAFIIKSTNPKIQ